jgi:uncharacterized protein (DUF1330 family)
MSAFFVALREFVHDPKEMQIYADKAGLSAQGHRLITRVAYGRLRMTEGAPIEGAVVLEFPTFEEAEAWYDSAAYQEAVVHRFRGATYRTFIVQGVE